MLIAACVIATAAAAISDPGNHRSYLPYVSRQDPPTPTPTPTPTVTPTPTETPLPSDLVVTTSRAFHVDDDDHDLIVVGVILNNTPAYRYVDDIVVTLYDAQDEVVASYSAPRKAHNMAPGQRAPFKHRISDEPPGWVRYTVDVHHDATSVAPVEFSFTQVVAHYDSAGDLHVDGTVTNVGSRKTLLLEVYVTLYDEDDEIVNCEGAWPPDLEPGESGPFHIRIRSSQPHRGWDRFEPGADGDPPWRTDQYPLIVLDAPPVARP